MEEVARSDVNRTVCQRSLHECTSLNLSFSKHLLTERTPTETFAEYPLIKKIWSLPRLRAIFFFIHLRRQNYES